MNAVDNTKFKYLGILIIELWSQIVNSYKAISQISEKRDDGSIGGLNKNTNSKNSHAKTGFITYNVTGVDVDAGVGNTSGTDDITEKVSNNINIGISQLSRMGEA